MHTSFKAQPLTLPPLHALNPTLRCAPACVALPQRFDGVPYQGKVLRYNPRSKWYFVLYCDRDCEELDEAEVLGILAPSG